MAHFYGTIQGARGEASRLGHKSSGLTVKAASWQGAVLTVLSHVDGRDWATVYLTRHRGAGIGIDRTLYDGPIDGRKVRKARAKTTAALVDAANEALKLQQPV